MNQVTEQSIRVGRFKLLNSWLDQSLRFLTRITLISRQSVGNKNETVDFPFARISETTQLTVICFLLLMAFLSYFFLPL